MAKNNKQVWRKISKYKWKKGYKTLQIKKLKKIITPYGYKYYVECENMMLLHNQLFFRNLKDAIKEVNKIMKKY